MQYAFYSYGMQDGELTLAITDLAHFKQYGYVNDWALGYLLDIPDFIYEVSPGLFVSSKDEKATAASLKKVGIGVNEEFNAYMAEIS